MSMHGSFKPKVGNSGRHGNPSNARLARETLRQQESAELLQMKRKTAQAVANQQAAAARDRLPN